MIGHALVRVKETTKKHNQEFNTVVLEGNEEEVYFGALPPRNACLSFLRVSQLLDVLYNADAEGSLNNSKNLHLSKIDQYIAEKQPGNDGTSFYLLMQVYSNR
jgi:hypothetical protein